MSIIRYRAVISETKATSKPIMKPYSRVILGDLADSGRHQHREKQKHQETSQHFVLELMLQ